MTTTPEQLQAWREAFESGYSKDDLFFQCGEYSDRYIQFSWQGYLRAKQETEQAIKDARKQMLIALLTYCGTPVDCEQVTCDIEENLYPDNIDLSIKIKELLND